MATVVTSIGLILDILGAVGLFRYGLPEALSRQGHVHLVAEQADEQEAARARRYDSLSRTSLGLLIAGFAFQFVGNLV